MEDIVVEVCNLYPDLPLPEYMSSGAAGVDLLAAVHEATKIKPGEICLIPTGICMAIPEGYEGQVRPRSGLALRYGLTCLNSPGTVDADYRGEIKVILINLGPEAYTIRRGERIAQMVFNRIAKATFCPVEKLESTFRGEGGFGSTGV